MSSIGTGPLKIGIVGAGANGRARHIPGFRAIPGVEIVSVANRSRESSERAAAEYEIPEVYYTWAELVAAPDTNAICVSTWPNMHATIAVAALEHGKHVLSEGRMAMNAAEAHAMLDAARRHPGLVAHVVPAPYTLEIDNAVIGLIGNGYLGDVLSVEVIANGSGFIDYKAPMHWRQDPDISGLNIMGMGIAYERIMRWVGPAASVSALGRVNVKSRRDGQGHQRWMTIPDHIEALCEMASGPVMHLKVSSISGIAPADYIALYGSEGTLRVDVNATSCRVFGGRRGDKELKELEVEREANGGWRVEEDFAESVRDGKPVTRTTFEDGVRYMEFTEAVVRSMQRAHRVALPL